MYTRFLQSIIINVELQPAQCSSHALVPETNICLFNKANKSIVPCFLFE